MTTFLLQYATYLKALLHNYIMSQKINKKKEALIEFVTSTFVYIVVVLISDQNAGVICFFLSMVWFRLDKLIKVIEWKNRK